MKGLPVSVLGDDAENAALVSVVALGGDEKRWLRGKGGASVFCPLKSQTRRFASLRKLCRGGSPDIRPMA